MLILQHGKTHLAQRHFSRQHDYRVIPEQTYRVVLCRVILEKVADGEVLIGFGFLYCVPYTPKLDMGHLIVFGIFRNLSLIYF